MIFECEWYLYSETNGCINFGDVKVTPPQNLWIFVQNDPNFSVEWIIVLDTLKFFSRLSNNYHPIVTKCSGNETAQGIISCRIFLIILQVTFEVDQVPGGSGGYGWGGVDKNDLGEHPIFLLILYDLWLICVTDIRYQCIIKGSLEV